MKPINSKLRLCLRQIPAALHKKIRTQSDLWRFSPSKGAWVPILRYAKIPPRSPHPTVQKLSPRYGQFLAYRHGFLHKSTPPRKHTVFGVRAQCIQFNMIYYLFFAIFSIVILLMAQASCYSRVAVSYYLRI